jgi:hypothetical protein
MNRTKRVWVLGSAHSVRGPTAEVLGCQHGGGKTLGGEKEGPQDGMGAFATSDGR